MRAERLHARPAARHRSARGRGEPAVRLAALLPGPAGEFSGSREDAHAVRQLACAQAAQFPDLAVSVHERTALRVRCALADRLARLVLAGHLRPCAPELAAEHFLVLLTGPLEYRPDAAPDTVADAAVDVFLRAYGT
ncbi:TetR/AcrR family transcriptional regulator C-terminal domain-containing protein [Streptomyces sp. NPDC001536]|uniref:TetR/AcrR family transcriptional regulator C-terminal domain-containing protein n=1 Tax=Streptomyces sp. NPDC001536 TaxID=3364583 RepID=UPI0036B877BB